VHKSNIFVLEVVATTAIVAIAFTVLLLLFPFMKSEVVAAWVQAIGSLGAIWVAVWLFYAQHEKAIERAKIEEESGIRNLLRSLQDEILVIAETFEKRNGKLLMEGKDGEAFLLILPFVDKPFPIYQSSIAHLGKIHNENLRRLIIDGYGRALGFVHNVKLNNVLIEKYENAFHVANIYNEDVHKSHRDQRLHQLNLYGNSLRDSYKETLAGASEMLKALEHELRQNP
jgi:hypothetical protein